MPNSGGTQLTIRYPRSYATFERRQTVNPISVSQSCEHPPHPHPWRSQSSQLHPHLHPSISAGILTLVASTTPRPRSRRTPTCSGAARPTPTRSGSDSATKSAQSAGATTAGAEPSSPGAMTKVSVSQRRTEMPMRIRDPAPLRGCGFATHAARASGWPEKASRPWIFSGS